MGIYSHGVVMGTISRTRAALCGGHVCVRHTKRRQWRRTAGRPAGCRSQPGSLAAYITASGCSAVVVVVDREDAVRF